MPFELGEQVGPYQIIEQLGRGGMATVFKAYHPALDRYVAIKGMHQAFLQDANFLARFQREARVVAKLDHPNIVPIFDYSQHEGQPYLVMKYIEGETLKVRLGRGLLSKDEIRQIVQAVGGALAYAHKQGILHRDIKPSNVLLGNDQGIYLTDFGLARIAQAGESTMSADAMLGTPQYISPEQAQGFRDLDEGTDIYSFGVLLYELVVGKVPFSADTPFSVVHDHIYKPLPLPRFNNPDIPEEVERVLLKSLAKKREDRFPTIEAQVQAFLAALPGEMTLHAPLPSLGETRKASPLRSPQVARVEAPKPALPEEGAQPAPPAVAEEKKIASPAGGEGKKPRRWRWWMWLPVVLSVCFCGLVVLGTLDQRRKNQALTPVPALTASPQPATPIPPSATPFTRGAVGQAIQAVQQDPENPLLHMELAAAFLEADQIAEAQRALNDAITLAKGDPEILNAEVDFLIDRQLWVEAAQVFVELARASNEPLSLEQLRKLDWVIYQAARLPRAETAFANAQGFEEIGVNPLMIEVARGRFALYQGNQARAQSLVDAVLAVSEAYPPALLLQAEIHIAQEATLKARATLETIIRPPAPVWIILEARRLLTTLP